MSIGIPHRGQPWTKPGAITARALSCTVTLPPDEGTRLRFGRNRMPEVEISVGDDDPRVSRQHGVLVYRQGRWWLSNTGRSPIQISDALRIHADDDPVPLSSGYTTLLITGSGNRKHLLELHITGIDGKYPAPALGFHTMPQRIWPLTTEQRLVLAVLGQQYILRDPHPQPLTRQQAADLLTELRPSERWTAKRVDRVVSRVRHALSRRGVHGLIREEVGEPVGNSLNHNLLMELAVRTETLKRADLALLGDIESR